MFNYLSANRTAGYSGFVVYTSNAWLDGRKVPPSDSVWMVPGTFFDDWDNQVKGE